jgi:hypothetical protein
MHTNIPNNVCPLCKIITILTIFYILIATASCSTPTQSSPVANPTSNIYLSDTDALVSFRVSLPEPLPPGDSISLTILDEVTGLSLNPKYFTMEAEDELHYFILLPIPLGTILQYRYQRQGTILAQEHLPDGRPVRYRLYHVEGPAFIEDIISRWTDTSYQSQGGELIGKVIDSSTNAPLPTIMVNAGGYQVYSSGDGTFQIKDLPPGIHNLVTYAPDGTYQPFQQGAAIESNRTTFAEISIEPSRYVTGTFVVDLPSNTPPVAPIRLAGNLSQFGNSFTDLSGGLNSLVSRMPQLIKTPDGNYRLTLKLPAGIDFRYKYSLGDGFWNAERTSNGEIALRQIVVPEHDFNIQETVFAWGYGNQGRINFETYIQNDSNKPYGLFIQLDPGFGWTEPLPMWSMPDQSVDSTRWSYIVNSPLDLVTSLRYRYCLEGLCGEPETIYPAELSQENYLTITDYSQTVSTQIDTWAGLFETPPPAIIPNVPVAPRNQGFTAGIAIQERYEPSWSNYVFHAISDIKSLFANWVFLQPTWTYTSYTPPTSEYTPSTNPGWNDLENWINHAHLLSLRTAIFPITDFNELDTQSPTSPATDTAKWRSWHDNYSRMVNHFATLASETNAEALVISDMWIAKPNNSNIEQAPQYDTSDMWREFIGNLRNTYQGKLIWATTYPEGIASPAPFLDLVDAIYVQWSPPLATQPDATSRQMRDEALRMIDNDLAPFWQQTNRPIILAIAYPSNTMTEQVDNYNAIMMAINDRPWLEGIVSTGYFPVFPLPDTSISVNGKPASGVLWYWFPLFLGE